MKGKVLVSSICVSSSLREPLAITKKAKGLYLSDEQPLRQYWKAWRLLPVAFKIPDQTFHLSVAFLLYHKPLLPVEGFLPNLQPFMAFLHSLLPSILLPVSLLPIFFFPTSRSLKSPGGTSRIYPQYRYGFFHPGNALLPEWVQKKPCPFQDISHR
jgi:hypothetical protein